MRLRNVRLPSPRCERSRIRLSHPHHSRLISVETVLPALTYHPNASNRLSPGDCSMKKAVLALAVLLISLASVFASISQAQYASRCCCSSPP